MLAIDWNATTIAGGFIIGAIAGVVATIRIFRWVLDYMARREATQRKTDD